MTRKLDIWQHGSQSWALNCLHHTSAACRSASLYRLGLHGRARRAPCPAVADDGWPTCSWRNICSACWASDERGAGALIGVGAGSAGL